MTTSFWHGRRVVVTGHTGFKGAWLHALGAEVTGFSGSPPSEPSLFEMVRVGELVDDRRGTCATPKRWPTLVRRSQPELVFHLAAHAIVRASNGSAVVLRYPDAVRPWQHMLDPLAGYLLLAERLHGSAECATGFNFGPDDARPVSWVVDRVRERWPVEVRVEPPGDAIEAPELRLDASAARERLGWVPRHDLASGLAATVSWYDEVRAGGDARAVTLRQIEDAT